MLSGSGSVVYGPYHRLRNQSTQSDSVAVMQQQSREVWGLAARWSHLRAVKAYMGPLPSNREGIEFMTGVAPSSSCPYNIFWYEGDPGVRINAQGYAVISVTVIKKVP
jgi:hypothetical protein